MNILEVNPAYFFEALGVCSRRFLLASCFTLLLLASGAVDAQAQDWRSTIYVIEGDREVEIEWGPDTRGEIYTYTVWRSTQSIEGGGGTKKAVSPNPLTTSQFVDKSVQNGETYYYVVESQPKDGDAQFSDEVVATPEDMTPPDVPEKITGVGSDSKTEVLWEANAESDMAGYNIYRSTSGFDKKSEATHVNPGALHTSTSFEDLDVVNGQVYFYRVTAVDQKGNESDLSEIVGITPDDETPPGEVVLTATEGTGSVTLTWDESQASDVLGYDLYRANHDFTNLPEAEKVNDTGPITSASYSDLSVDAGIQYYYRVVVVDRSLNESEPSNYVVATPKAQTNPDTEPPAKPIRFAASAGDEKISLSWEIGKASDLDGYNLYRSSSSFSDTAAVTRINESGLIYGTTFTDTTVDNGSTYHYRLAAVDRAGNASLASDLSSATPSDVVPPASPEALTREFELDSETLTLHWSGAVDAAAYKVYRSTAPFTLPHEATEIEGEARDTLYAQPDLRQDTRYYYRVSAVDQAGNESGLSPIVTFINNGIQLDPPSSVSVTVDNGEVKITWDAASGEADAGGNEHSSTDGGSRIEGINVYRSTSPFTKRTEATKLNNEPLTSGTYTDRGLEVTTDNYYAVTKVADNGEESGITTPAIVRSEQVAGPEVDLMSYKTSASASVRNGVELTWVARERVEGTYHIERSLTRSSGTNKTVGASETVGGNQTAARFDEIKSMEAKGQTGEPITYTYHDDDLPFDAESASYRLVHQRPDGTRTVLSEVEKAFEAPSRVRFIGNAPNPASGPTTIRYELSETTRVRLSVYNMIGQRVALLVDRRQTQGRKDLSFNTGSLPSGTYMLHFTAGDETLTRRMSVVR